MQQNLKAPETGPSHMLVIALMTARAISIQLPPGSGGSDCRLDLAGLAEASCAVACAVSEEVVLIIVTNFRSRRRWRLPGSRIRAGPARRAAGPGSGTREAARVLA
ncbi:DUF2478 domain-containing protein [Mesorhizobium sp. M0317]|uniref:DUF2478 domain-containing protein n=1 Tax=Mesorhizobium sp. M0317 TaxID=2956935 RepID=UPI00333C171A